jgi:hypothetical protein
MNNKYEDQKSERIIFHNKKKVITNAKEKTKRKICFYFVLSHQQREERPEILEKAEFWQAIWDDPEQSN